MNFVCSNREYLSNILDDIKNNYETGSIVNISYDIIKQQKTYDQIKYIFGGLIKSLRKFFNELGYEYDSIMIKDWLYCACKVFKVEYMPNGLPFITGNTLSEMTKREASKFIQDVIFYIDNSTILKDFILPPDMRYCWTHNVTNEVIAHIKQEKINNFDSYYLRHQSKLTCIKCGAKGGMVYHLKRTDNKDYLTIPLCGNCYNKVNTHGESYLTKDIKAVLNGLSIDDFCLSAYHYWKKHY